MTSRCHRRRLTIAGSPTLNAKITTLGLDNRAFAALSVGTSPLDARIVQNNMLPIRENCIAINKPRTGIELPSVAVDVPAGQTPFLTVSPVSDMDAGFGSRVVGAVTLKDVVVHSLSRPTDDALTTSCVRPGAGHRVGSTLASGTWSHRRRRTMQLHAVIVPPPEVVEDALEGARALVPSTSAAAAEAAGGFLGRLLGRRSVSAPSTTALAWAQAAPEEVFVRLAKFGNVTAGDATHLATAIGAKAGKWRAPALHVSTLSVAPAHPYVVAAQLDGDLDALRDIFLNVNEVARLERFFLDRRSFRNELLLGPIEVTGDEPAPDDLAGKELAHEGPQWTPSHVTLFRATYAAAGVTYSEFARLPLADAAEDLGARPGA